MEPTVLPVDGVADEQENTLLKGNAMDKDQGESEDEEVKRNCIMGLSGLRDSDFSDTDDDADDNENEDQNEPEDDEDAIQDELQQCLVQFVPSGQMISKPQGEYLYRPTPITAAFPAHREQNNDDNRHTDSDSAERASERFEPAPFVSNERNKSVHTESSSSEDENDQEDQVSSDHDEPAVLPAVSRSLVQAAVNHQHRGEDSDANTDEDSNCKLNEEQEEDYAAIMLVVDEPTAISDVVDEKIDQPDRPDSEEEGEEEYYTFIGASVDDKWAWSKQKRVLSSNTLAALNHEAGRNADSPKRMKSFARAEPHGMPELSLGLAAFNQPKLLPRHDVIRDESPFLSSDDDEDRMLSEELEEKLRDTGGENSPIPLLTPPQSPRRGDEVEWPSNLVIDSALMNTVNELRPLSPASLQNMEEEEEERLRNHDIEPSTLTPLLRSIHVGTT